MGDKTRIEWAEATWNPLVGTRGRWFCTKVSSGCKNCYSERINLQMGGTRYAYGEDRIVLDKKIRHGAHNLDGYSTLDQPIRWKKPRKIFVCSMTDIFHESVSMTDIHSIFGVMFNSNCRQHTFFVLTKRPERMLSYISYAFYERGLSLPKNIWLGVSVEDQSSADTRIPLLLKSGAAVKFVSAEPLLDEIKPESFKGVDWVIVGGESGQEARPMHQKWARDIRDYCEYNGIPFLFKQWGEWLPDSQLPTKAINAPPGLVHCETAWIGDWSGSCKMLRVGKKSAGRELDGRIHDGYPDVKGKNDETPRLVGFYS